MSNPVHRIIEAVGGESALAERLQAATGRKVNSKRVEPWRRSGRIPHWAILPMWRLAQGAHLSISLDDLEAVAGLSERGAAA